MKPTIYFDPLKDEFYPNGCWMCGNKNESGDKGIGDTPKAAYLDWFQWNKL